MSPLNVAPESVCPFKHILNVAVTATTLVRVMFSAKK